MTEVNREVAAIIITIVATAVVIAVTLTIWSNPAILLVVAGLTGMLYIYRGVYNLLEHLFGYAD